MVQHLQYPVFRYYNSIPICFSLASVPALSCRWMRAYMPIQTAVSPKSIPLVFYVYLVCYNYLVFFSYLTFYTYLVWFVYTYLVFYACILTCKPSLPTYSIIYIYIYLLWLPSGLVYCGYLLQYEYLACFTFLISLLCFNNLLNVLFFHALLVSFNNIKPILSNRTHIKFIVLQSLAREILFIKRVH